MPKSDCEDELNIQQKSIEEVIEMQADLSETYGDSLNPASTC